MSIEKYNICQICEKIIRPKIIIFISITFRLKTIMKNIFPKDLYSGEKLLFKNLDSYVFNDFTDKVNLRKYLESFPGRINKTIVKTYYQNENN